MVRLLERLIVEVRSPNNLLSSLVQTNWRYTDSRPPEPKIIYGTSPSPDLLTDAMPLTPSVVGGPSPRRGNASGFRRAFEAEGLGVHVARRTRTAAPRPRSTPLTSTRGVLCPGAINLAEIRDLVPGSGWARSRDRGRSPSRSKSIYV